MDDHHDVWRSPSWQQRAAELAASYHAAVGRALVDEDGDLGRTLFYAPFVLVSHGTEDDPILNYGNASALTLWNVDVDALCSMPSRLTAEPVHRDERADMLARVTRDGYIDDYAGVRITADGRRFRIDQATVWNVFSADGSPAGQAAMFTHWKWLDETIG